MKILCVFGQHNYGDRSRGTGYEYTNFIPALRGLGHEIAFFECWDKTAYRDFTELNHRFLEVVETERPDVVFCVLMNYEIWLETLELARRGSQAAFIHWSTDDSWRYEQFSRFIAPAFDLYATTYHSALEKAKRDGYENFELTQWAANSDAMNEPMPADQCRYRVSFIGTAYGNRIRWIEKLRKNE